MEEGGRSTVKRLKCFREIKSLSSEARQFEDLVQSCKDLVKPDIGYDEDELRRHIRAIMDERRRMVREGYSYADVGETSSTDDSDEKAGEKNICGEEGSDGDHSLYITQSKTNGSRRGKGKRSSSGEKALEQYICGEEGSDDDHSFETSQSKTNESQRGKEKRSSDEKAGEGNISDKEGSDGDQSLEATQSKTNGSQHGKGKRISSNHESVSPEITDESTSDAFEDEFQLPGGATTVPLSTAETILLAFFKNGYTKEIRTS